jgi:asparagine synthase (glutamine-hydrolysing)
VARHTLPEEVLERKKTGFSIPIRDWLMEPSQAASRDRGLRGWARLLLSSN